jgi:hypothetical protein
LIAEAHFLISWKPYYYDILIQVRISADWDGSALLLWGQTAPLGPEFGGTATFLDFVHQSYDRIRRFIFPLSRTHRLANFKASFLPSETEVCTIAVTQGLVRQLEQANGNPLFIVNAKDFELVTFCHPTKQALTMLNP